MDKKTTGEYHFTRLEMVLFAFWGFWTSRRPRDLRGGPFRSSDYPSSP